MSHRIDGFDSVALATHIGAPRVELFESVGSTMDEAHRLAEAGAPSGTVVVADHQLAGRGRLGRKWTSDPDAGLWMTAVFRNVPASGLDVLSIRIGLALAPALDPFANRTVQLKWPNDLLVGGNKLAGILVEARWRDARLEWVAVGIGINLVAPADQPAATQLREGVARSALLTIIHPAIAAVCAAEGDLSDDELAAWSARDSTRDASVIAPAVGVARGITANGTLIVDTAQGREFYRRGSLVLATEER